MRKPQKNEHHLWMNNGIWWIHFVPAGKLKADRVRHSLKTNDLTLARYERDEILGSILLTTRGENKKLTTSRSK
jgi:hypothetical protein